MRPTDLMRNVLLPAVAAIGREWESGLVTVAQEHFASQLARRYASRLMDLYQPATGFRPVLCACAPREQHELGLLAVAIEIRSRGFPVIYLGPDVPMDSLASAAESVHPGVVVVSVTLPEHLAGVAAAEPMLARIERAAAAPIIWAGPASEYAAGHGLLGRTATTIDQAVAEIRRAMRRPGFVVSEN
jgi:methanogenic corrinoid protein MtbC1